MRATARLAIGIGLFSIRPSADMKAQMMAGRGDSVFAADSVVLERTSCFGTCPAYRLGVSRSGRVQFESRNTGDDKRRASDSMSAADFEQILIRAHFIDFWSLPDRIADDKRFCPQDVSDNPTAMLTVFTSKGFKRVEDYYGCFWAPAGLRDLEHYIDDVTNAKRWIRPATIR